MLKSNFEKSYFDNNYSDYFRQNPAYKLRAILSAIKRKHPKGRRLLDVGCGLGAFLDVAKSSGYSVSGADISDFAVKFLSKKFSVKKCLITRINYPSSSFDVITVLDVIEHVPNIDKALSELKRVCKKGGLIVFTIPVYDGITGKIVNIMDKDITHVNKFSRHKWLDIIGKRVEIIEWQGIIRYFFMKKHYLHIQTIFLRKACPAILIICKNNK